MRLLKSAMTHPENNGTVGAGAEILSSKEKLPEPVYCVESPDDATVLVGIDVTIEHYVVNGQDVSKISWYDTSHERIMLASETQQKNGVFAFKRIEREGGGIYYFSPMNLEIYDDRVKHRLVNGSDFTNNEDLIKAFLSTTENEV